MKQATRKDIKPQSEVDKWLLRLIELLILFSIALAIKPVWLAFSGTSLKLFSLLPSISANTPIFIFPLLLGAALVLWTDRSLNVDFKKLSTSSGVMFLVSGITFLCLELFHDTFNFGILNLRICSSVFWVGVGLVSIEIVTETFPKLKLLSLRAIFYSALLMSLLLLFIYIFFRKSQYEYFHFFYDTPLGQIHQQAFVACLGVFVLFFADLPEMKNRIIKSMISVVFFTVIIGNFSRGALVTLFAIFLPFVFKKWKTFILLLFVGFGLIFSNTTLTRKFEGYSKHLSLNIFHVLKGKIKSGKDESASIRINSSIKALEAFRESPLLGVGFEQVPRYYSVSMDNSILTHTFLIIVISSYGVIGFVPFLLSAISMMLGSRSLFASCAAILFLGGASLFLPYLEDWIFLVPAIISIIPYKEELHTDGRELAKGRGFDV